MNASDPTASVSESESSGESSSGVSVPLDLEQLRRATAHWPDVQVTFERVFSLSANEQLAAAVGVDEAGERARVMLLCNITGRPMLHWGLGMRSTGEWQHPPKAMQPAGSKPFDERAIRSPLAKDEGWFQLELELQPIHKRLPRAVNLVIYDALNDRWLKHGEHDIQLRLRRPRSTGGAALEPVIEAIVEAETGESSWTLMHRFNLCFDLLDDVEGDPDGMALLFAWLRYSSMRQLDWQRQYNTKPSELAHAQHRLTSRLATLFEPHNDSSREIGMWARLTLSTVGRGGEGQQVRDRILQIMHRHHIKERRGTWIEQWHQKLHNNTTPDDIVICQAYIAFMESDGDEHAYWRTLEAGEVTRERLASFERPITLEPDYFPDKKDGLLHDFHEFLYLLKSVHSGTDLETSIDAAFHLLGQGLADWLRQLLHRHADTPDALVDLVRELTEARLQLHGRLANQSDGAARRDLLYVDLGVEAMLRTAVERVDISHAPDARLGDMTRSVLTNLALTEPDGEYDAALRMWQQLDLDAQTDREAMLAALATVDRTGRAVRDQTDRLYERLQPKAEQLGRQCKVDQWTISIFSEEVVRGTLAFVLSKLVRHLEPALRSRAGLGGWQIISPGDAIGRVDLVGALREVQGRRFDEPTVLIADEVAGDEDIPGNVRAVLTRQTPDIVSHVAVRARNERVLLASCLDASVYEQLHGQRQRRVHVTTTASGDVFLEPAGDQNAAPTTNATPAAVIMLQRPQLSAEVIGAAQFNEMNVGGKSNNLLALRDQLPEGIAIPPSAALTFGTFEHVLKSRENEAVAAQYRSLLQRVDDEPGVVLPKLREKIQQLVLPESLRARIVEVCQREGITLPEQRDALWRAIGQVWASQWTDRAYWARQRLGLPHADLVMAALIQQVVEADYAFVLHTTDPTTADANTLYGEVVVGLGETLVGNYPGTPLAFRVNKQGLIVELLSLPSKSIALRNSGGGTAVIVRSDSNGEDLPGYAGAGLHDSVLTDPPRAERLDYTHEPLVQDRAFRDRLCRSIAELGIAIEAAAGSAQDIEGAVQGDRIHALQTRTQVGL